MKKINMLKVFIAILALGAVALTPAFAQAPEDELSNVPMQIPSDNPSTSIIEEPKFNGYIVQLQDEPVSKIYVEEVKKVEKGVLTKRVLHEKTNDHRKNVIDKQNAVENQIKSIIPSAKVDSKVQNVFNGFAVFDISEEEAEQLKSLPEVKEIYKNYEVRPNLMNSVPSINADDVWQLTDSGGNSITGEGITIGIIDTGVDYTHADLGGCFGTSCKVVDGWDFVNNDADPMDDNSHGTHVAAIAAGNGGLKGVAPGATIYAYKVLSAAGPGTQSNIIAAVNRSTDPNQDGDFSDHLDVINLSLGSYGRPNDAMSQAVDNSVDLGVVAVVGAGNSGPDIENYCRHTEDPSGLSYSICSPGTARKAITVGASGNSGNILGFSSRGPTTSGTAKPDISAPGGYVCAARLHGYNGGFSCSNLDNTYVAFFGTSMAAPHVAGAVALIKQDHSDWTPTEIKYALRDSATDTDGNILTGGWGKIDVLSAIQLPTPLTPVINPLGSAVFSLTDIYGEIDSANFVQYSLDYMSADSAVDGWTNIVSSSVVPSGNVLFEGWNTPSVSSGLYIVKLTVTDTNSRTWSDAVPIKIDNSQRIQLKAGLTASPTTEVNNLVAMSGQAVYFKAIATSFGNPQGICNNCQYQWYKDDVLVSSNNLEYTTNFSSSVSNMHTIKFVLTDTATGASEEKSVIIEIDVKQLTTNLSVQQYPAIYGDKIVWEDYRNGNRDIYMYDLSANTEIPITTHPSTQRYPAIYGDKIVWADYRNGNADIYMYDLSTNTETRITSNPYDQDDPAIYGDKIVWEDYRNDVSNNQIYVYDLSTNTETPITPVAAQKFNPAIYGDKIVWEDYRNGNGDIYMYDLSTNIATQITTYPFASAQHPYSPTIYGDKIIWAQDWYGNYNIYMHDLSTDTRTSITATISVLNSPAIYGDKIVWEDYRNGNSDIYMYDLSTNTEIPITTHPSIQRYPAIYGNKIVWQDNRNGNLDIFLSNAPTFQTRNNDVFIDGTVGLNDPSDSAYCPDDDCVYNGVCYDVGEEPWSATTYTISHGTNKKLTCSNWDTEEYSMWLNVDYSKFSCDQGGYHWHVDKGDANIESGYNPQGGAAVDNYYCAYNWVNDADGTKTRSTECCCGDDAGEYFMVSPQDGSSACCNTNNELVIGGVCQNSSITEICGDGIDNNSNGFADECNICGCSGTLTCNMSNYTCVASDGGRDSCPACFLKGTPILMADGSFRPIEKVKVGDNVLAFDEESGELKPDKVTEFFEHTTEKYLIINGRLKVTDNHPVYSNGKWVEAGELKVGDKLVSAKGEAETITSIKEVKRKAKVYNLEVNPYHTYIAGGIVVHNKTDKCKPFVKTAN